MIKIKSCESLPITFVAGNISTNIGSINNMILTVHNAEYFNRLRLYRNQLFFYNLSPTDSGIWKIGRDEIYLKVNW